MRESCTYGSVQIPIVFGLGNDPVELGLVASLNRPGGNVTGMTSLSGELTGKQFGMLHELLPQASHFGFLSDPKAPIHESAVKDAQAAASAIGGTIDILTASTSGEIDGVFVRIANEKRVQGLLVASEALTVAARVQLAILAARFAIPAIYPSRDFVNAGGLLSYGPDMADRDRQVGRYVGRILKGEKPGDLPVMQSGKFDLVVNLKTAKALGLTIPETLLATADEVIQ
jgi:putative tryptophan/tyrosine transport system substrate-binding protein